MRKKFIYFIIVLGAVFLIQTSVMAFTTPGPTGFDLKNPLKYNTFDQLVDAIADIIIKIGSVVAVIFIIYSGFLFVTARGSDEQIIKAKSVFMWTVIGTAVLLGAAVIAKAVVNFVQGLQ